MSRRSGLVPAVVLVSVIASGCTGQAASPPAASPSTAVSPSAVALQAGANCPPLASNGAAVRFPSGDVSLAGLTIGRGKTGVVLVGGPTDDVCGWLTYAVALGKAGYRVLTFDPAGAGASTERHQTDPAPEVDVLAAVTYLRANGVGDVVLMGAGAGAAEVIVAATKVTPPPTALVALSPPLALSGVDVSKTAGQLRMPAMYVVSDQDPQFAPLTSAGKPVRGANVYRCQGSQHGTGILIGACAVDLEQTLNTFLNRAAPPA